MEKSSRKVRFHLLLWGLFALSALSALLIRLGPTPWNKPTAEPESQPSPRRPATASRTFVV